MPLEASQVLPRTHETQMISFGVFVCLDSINHVRQHPQMRDEQTATAIERQRIAQLTSTQLGCEQLSCARC